MTDGMAVIAEALAAFLWDSGLGMYSCCGPLVCFALSLLDFQSYLVSVAGDANQGEWDCWSVLLVNLYEFTIGP